MSKKVTFGELIESIAEETDNSKQFTHDFLKDFVDIINDGLEEDGKVNIAGFGKFELQSIDERQGYNPQTQDKITIPAHNKIVFKPYKDLRELVNAPYSHMEAQLIEKEGLEPSNKNLSTPDQQTTESQTAGADIESDGSAKETDRLKKEQKSEPDNAESSDDDDGDIVEFGASQLDAEDDLFEEFIGSEEEQQDDSTRDLEEPEPRINITPESETEPVQTAPSEEDDNEKKPINSEKEVLGEEIKKLEQAAEDLRQYQPDQSDQQDTEDPLPTGATSRPSSQRYSSFSYVAAAAIVLLLFAGVVWYYSTLPASNTVPISSSEKTPASADMTNKQDNNNQQQSAEQQEAKNSQQTTQDQTQSATPLSSTSNQAIEIEQGQTLWSLAEDRYGNPRLWPWIYGNNATLDDPDLIYAGSSFSVPLPSGPQNTLTSTDSVGVAKGFIATYKWYKSNEQSKAKNHLWAAKLYHSNLQQLADVPIDKKDLSYANRAR